MHDESSRTAGKLKEQTRLLYKHSATAFPQFLFVLSPIPSALHSKHTTGRKRWLGRKVMSDEEDGVTNSLFLPHFLKSGQIPSDGHSRSGRPFVSLLCCPVL